MIVIPAIDIRGGKVVRLTQGQAVRETVYSDSPLEMVRKWASFGVELIHVVDLDGAIEGRPDNIALIKEMAGSVKTKIELGGGLRDEKIIAEVIDAGVEKVVLGTKALDGKFLSGIVKKFGDRIVAGIDARDGIVYTKGWIAKTKTKAADLAKKMQDIGVKTINYTDISRDGMLKGPNVGSLKNILGAVNIDVIASGGVSTLEDVKTLKALEPDGLKGMIIGKALYEGKIDLGEAIKICSQKE